MLMRLRWCVLWGCFLLVSAGAAVGQGTAPYTLKRVDVRPGLAGFDIADVDGDGVNEIIELRADNGRYFVRKFSREMVWGPALYQGTSPYWIRFVKPLEIDSTPGMELALPCKDMQADSAWLEIVAGADKSRVLCRTEAVHGQNLNNRNTRVHPGWDGCMVICEAVDLNNDGVREIILSINVAFDLYPRGLYVYQYPTGRLLWHFPMAGNPREVKFGDADSDGCPEIFVKTWADANGAVVGDQSDTTAEVFALDHTGRLLWRAGTGDRFEFHTCNIEVGDYDGDGTLEIYYGVLLRSDEFDRQVQVLEKHRAVDNQFLQQLPFDAQHNFRQVVRDSAQSDSLSDLILNNDPSRIDSRAMTVVAAGSYPRCYITGIRDFGLSGSKGNGGSGDRSASSGFILTKADSLYLVDRDFRLLAAYGTETGGSVGQTRYFRSPFGGDYLGVLVASGDGQGGNILYILEIAPVKGSWLAAWWSSGRATWAVATAAFLLGIPAGIALITVVFRRRRGNGIHQAAHDNLLSALTAFGHGQMARRNLTRLAFLFSNLPETPEKVKEIRPNIQAALGTFRTITAEQLDIIIAHGRRIPRFRPLVDDLNEQTRRLKAIVGGSASAAISNEDLKQMQASIPEAIESVRQTLKKLETRIQPVFSSDLLKEIQAVLVSCAGLLRQHEVKVSQLTVLGDCRHLAFFPPSELAAVLEELITNACRAMRGSAARNLSFRLEYTADQAIIDVIDTGEGLTVDNPEKLFSRQFSTKGPGGGYGLFQARQTIERFGGKIRILANPNGSGVTVRMIFKGIPRE